jgi:hypothetical protein
LIYGACPLLNVVIVLGWGWGVAIGGKGGGVPKVPGLVVLDEAIDDLLVVLNIFEEFLEVGEDGGVDVLVDPLPGGLALLVIEGLGFDELEIEAFCGAEGFAGLECLLLGGQFCLIFAIIGVGDGGGRERVDKELQFIEVGVFGGEHG